MDFKEFYAGENDSGRRLDKILRRFLNEMSLSELYKCIRKGLIKVNDKKINQNYKVNQQDKISIAAFLIEKNNSSSQDSKEKTETAADLLSIMPEIVFQNKDLIILNKPYGQLVQGSSVSLDKVIEQYYKKNSQDDSLGFRTGPLHRLDKNTTGLLAFSWSIKGAHWFSENIQNHIVQKHYRGIVQGKITEKETWLDTITKEYNKENKFQTVNIEHNDTENNSHTEVTPVAYGKYNGLDITYVDFLIKTGRTHQIRAQSSLHKHPLLGDTAYGGTRTELKNEYFLHAYELHFPSENPLELPEVITAELPDDFKYFLSKTCDI